MRCFSPAQRALLALACACLVPVLSAGPASAAPAFIPLGTDAAGDNSPTAVKATDIISAEIATDGADLLFRFGLSATSEPAGSFCWAMGFEANGEEVFPVVCAEFVAGQHISQVGWTTETSSSRGRQIDEATAAFETGALVLRIPLTAAGLTTGQAITDIYALTYNQRGVLNLADVLPDAKSDRAAAENLGTYVVGSGAVSEGSGTVRYVSLTGATVTRSESYAAPTNETVQYNWTTTYRGGTFFLEADVKAGLATFEVVDGANATVVTATATGESQSKAVSGQAGDWRIVVRLAGFQGNYTFTFGEASQSTSQGPSSGPSTSGGPTTTGGDGTTTGDGGGPGGGNATKPATAFGFIYVVAGLSVALVRRRLTS